MENRTEDSTKASGVEYPVTYRVFESIPEAVEEMDGGEEAVLENLNSRQRQSALQSPKGQVRDAVEAALEAGFSENEIQSAVDSGETDEEALQSVLDAIEAHQTAALEFILGSPRGSSSGLTKTAKREFGERLGERYDDDPEALRELADELGVDVEDLF